MIYKNIILTNSAIMPNDGTYMKKTISKNQFIKLIKEADVIKSHIGYDSVCNIVKDLTDKTVKLNRGYTQLCEHYLLVGLTLPFRLSTKSKGRLNPTCDDYVYFMGIYNS